jgi:hypothetical protein
MIVVIRAICAVLPTNHVVRHGFAPSLQIAVSLTPPYSVPIIELDSWSPAPRAPLARFRHGGYGQQLVAVPAPPVHRNANVSAERVAAGRRYHADHATREPPPSKQPTGRNGKPAETAKTSKLPLPTAQEALVDDLNRPSAPQRRVLPECNAAQTTDLRTLDEHRQ